MLADNHHQIVSLCIYACWKLFEIKRQKKRKTTPWIRLYNNSFRPTIQTHKQNWSKKKLYSRNVFFLVCIWSCLAPINVINSMVSITQSRRFYVSVLYAFVLFFYYVMYLVLWADAPNVYVYFLALGIPCIVNVLFLSKLSCTPTVVLLRHKKKYTQNFGRSGRDALKFASYISSISFNRAPLTWPTPF